MQIGLERVWKGYRLTSTGRKIRQLPSEWWASLRSRGIRKEDQFWALRDATFGVRPGESLGVVGRNGAGKSTMLRLIAGVTYPTRGTVTVRGRVGALVDVGAGMHPELTGRENIHLFGAMLGLPRLEIRRHFDAIVEFSELQKFLDVPLKWYSTGMKVRLGFAVAAFLHPDLLLIDEVLAVGDFGFQQKCINHIQRLHHAGTTIVFVSHALRVVQYICQRTAWLEEGRIIDAGPSAEVLLRYRAAMEEQYVEQTRASSERSAIKVQRIVVTDGQDARRSEFAPGEDLAISVYYTVEDGPSNYELFLRIVDGTNRTMTVVRSGALARKATSSGQEVARCLFPSIPLGSGNYYVWGRVVRLQDNHEEVPWQPVAVFSVPMPHAMDRSWKEALPWETPLLTLPVQWTHDGATPEAVAAEESAADASTLNGSP